MGQVYQEQVVLKTVVIQGDRDRDHQDTCDQLQASVDEMGEMVHDKTNTLSFRMRLKAQCCHWEHLTQLSKTLLIKLHGI